MAKQSKFYRSPVAYTVFRLGGQKKIFDLLRQSDEKDAKRVVKAWDKLHTVANAEANSLDDVLHLAGLSPKEFIKILCGELFEHNVDVGKAIHQAHYPAIMHASVKRAIEPDATAERRMHFEASGFLPTKAGIQIGIKNINQTMREEEVVAPGRVPSFDRTARRIVRELPPAEKA